MARRARGTGEEYSASLLLATVADIDSFGDDRDHGRIVGTIEDYAVVRELVAELLHTELPRCLVDLVVPHANFLGERSRQISVRLVMGSLRP